ncbi:hypothetical protein [Limosilactobacillus mucosae]|uniref:Uncharacterized protein n=1 Tax=Limosilactobacillus mucosae TaxID=97478 RepID=A0AAJ1M6V4_LIMMU|nr:hypothetical protein [Limosilactobacillus mucosae]MDC2827472.1 hypothetical protein [Limosilactobacillus mucosae]MDC2835138.1 hypothetical protein [Limosilactobacillus mucosae]
MTKNYLDDLSIRACSWVLQALTDDEKGEKADAIYTIATDIESKSIDPIFDDNLSVWDQILQTIENRANLQIVDYVDDLLNHADHALIKAIETLSKAKKVSQYSRDQFMFEQGVIDLYSAF